MKGDEARNRFRDPSNGPWIDGFRMRRKEGLVLGFAADHVGAGRPLRHEFRAGHVQGSFQSDQVRTREQQHQGALHRDHAGVLRVTTAGAADRRRQRHARHRAAGDPEQLPRSVRAGHRRHITSGASNTSRSQHDHQDDLSHTTKTGSILYSGTFGFSNAVDIPQPINQNTSAVNLTIEHQHKDILLRAGYTGSYFRNDASLITWDSPYRLTDLSTLSSQGRTQVAPSNNWSAINASFSRRWRGTAA